MSGGYNLTLALNSPGFAKECYINYYYQNNTMGISAKDMGAIVQAYEEKIPSWASYAELDINDYEIDDDDVDYGREQARNDSGYDGKNAGQIANTAGSAALTLGEATLNSLGKEFLNTKASNLFNGLIEKCGDKAAEKAIKKASGDLIMKKGTEALGDAGISKLKDEVTTEIGNNILAEVGPDCSEEMIEGRVKDGIKKKGEEVIKDEASNAAKDKATKNIGVIFSCTMDAASAGKYRLTKPNKEQMGAVNTYSEALPTKQEETAMIQDNSNILNEELIVATDDANSVCEDANTYMADDMTDYGVHQRTIEYTQAAITSGYQLDEKDIEQYQEAVEIMEGLSDDVDCLSEEAQSIIKETYTDMEGAQSEFDSSAETVSNIDGYVAEADSVSSSTQLMANIECASQTLNGTMAGIDAYKAGAAAVATGWSGLGVLYGAAAAAAALAVVSDGFAVKEQFEYSNKCGDAIDACDATSDLNKGTFDLLNTNYENYQGLLSDVGDLEIEVPDDMEVPEELPAQETTEDGQGTDNSSINPNPTKKKPQP